MAEYAVQVSDSNGTTILVNVAVPAIGKAHWEVVNDGFLRRQEGVADVGERGAKQTYIGLYGSREVDDKYLVMHLDDFLKDGGARTSGTGVLYKQDNRLMLPGPVNWKIAY